MKKLLFLTVLLVFLSCGQNKKETETKPETTIATEVPETTVETENTPETKTVEGTVLEINNGKDGYTAKIETTDNELYWATISIPNLENPNQYKTVQVGDKIKVTGDFWVMENHNQITTRAIN